ncbi:MAG: hypothetical protein FWD64_08955, partial [Acidobacteriaceae bacterium]|nr:hypothetical protein [Acidobacteriaceae bacterium]
RYEESRGDTWIAAWAEDDNLYSPSNDTTGFRKACHTNVAFNRLEGSDPLHLSGTTVNTMEDYGKAGQTRPDAATWKSTGCMWIDGALYLVVSRHIYGDDSGDLMRRQTAADGSIIMSTDFGETWKRSEQENYDNPMFGGRRFATPYFIQYGYGHREVTEDGADKYVYATANNGFWDCGDDMVLGRVERSKLSRLDGKDWEFYVGGDGMQASAWSKNLRSIKQLLVAPGRFGMTGAVYLPDLRRYFMVGWYYPAGGGKIAGASTHTVWDFYESPKPWGPWTRVGSYDSTPDGWYSPEICPKFQDGKRIFALTAGNWDVPEHYRLTAVELKLETSKA